MITYVKGNLFESPAQVLVNTVNTVGVMGKGVALEFKRLFPEMFQEYQELCEQKLLDIGTLHLYRTPHKFVLNFPTKTTWRKPSKLAYIEAGLAAFVRIYPKEGIESVAFPPLGCGNGELDFNSQVKPLMQKYLRPLPIPIFVYPEKPRQKVAEHRDTKAMSEWLRSEPAALPFDEVWQDLLTILEEGATFKTAAKGRPYVVHSVEAPPTLVIETHAGRKNFKLKSEELLDFWQQLRQFGFTYRSVASEHYRLSYLIPLFERLRYVRRVIISTSDEGLEKNQAVALQVVPPSRPHIPQADLFAPMTHEEKG